MKVQKLGIDIIENLEFINSLKLKYSLEYFNDRIDAKRDFDEININDLIEGRYFSEDKELRIIKVNGNYKVILISDEENENYLECEHLVIDNKFGDIKKVGVKKYVDYDKDGQAYIKCIRPFKFI